MVFSLFMGSGDAAGFKFQNESVIWYRLAGCHIGKNLMLH